jgi:hypothetical protein
MFTSPYIIYPHVLCFNSPQRIPPSITILHLTITYLASLYRALVHIPYPILPHLIRTLFHASWPSSTFIYPKPHRFNPSHLTLPHSTLSSTSLNHILLFTSYPIVHLKLFHDIFLKHCAPQHTLTLFRPILPYFI